MAAPRRRLIAGACVCLGIALFVALGVWQLQRREWKLALIARTTARVHAAPLPAPGPPDWPNLTAANAGYRHVSATGHYLASNTLTEAVTEFGSGYWVLTPLVTDRGFTVLINRGFIAQDQTHAMPPPAGALTVTGLLRLSEPKGGFLRANDPAQHRWYSRDTEAIGQAAGISHIAPYFIDQDASPAANPLPRPGLTVISFRNDHLSYALTWFTLAAILGAGACMAVLRV